MHRNNLDFLRLIFACLVLITHSYVLSLSNQQDFISVLTHGQINCSSLGVKGFFIISGFLIYRSAMSSKNVQDYLVKRILRIYPAFIVMLIVMFFLGLIVSSQTVGQYFHNRSALSYIPVNLAMFKPQQYNIDGVFETNPYKGAINGSIWTIPYEFLFYLLIAMLFFIRKHRKIVAGLFFIGYLLLWTLVLRYEDSKEVNILNNAFELHRMAHFGLCFFGGAILAIIKLDQYRYKHLVLIAALIGLCGCVITRTFYFSQFLWLPLIIISFGTYASAGIAGLNKKMGDFSYGIYLYGFPVQQTLLHYYHFNYWELMLISIPVTFILGMLSWHIIEKRALKLKTFFP